MNLIVNIDSRKFSLNGIQYFKNYISNVAGNNLKIINAYDSNDVLLDWQDYTQISVNGIVYGSVALLQQNLIDACFNRAVGIDPSDFLSSNVANYTDATLPIADTDDLFVIQDGIVKKVNKSDIITGGGSAGGWKQILGFPFFYYVTVNPSSFFGNNNTGASVEFNNNLNTNNANLLVASPKTTLGLINEDSILNKISFICSQSGGNFDNVDIAILISDDLLGTNSLLIYNGTNLSGKVNIENLNISIQKNKVLNFAIKCNTFVTYYNYIHNLQIFLK